jgi:hypothetical protein
MAKVRHYKRLPTGGLLVAMAATGVLVLYGESLSITAVEIILGVVSIGLGTVLPVTMVTTQNAVASHQMGTATGTANFFRSLGGAFIVAIFGAIVLSGSGITGAASFEAMSEVAARSGVNLGNVFSHVFLAAVLGFGLSLAFLLALEERPLRGNAMKAAEAAVAD